MVKYNYSYSSYRPGQACYSGPTPVLILKTFSSLINALKCLLLSYHSKFCRAGREEILFRYFHSGLPWWLSGKESSCNARVAGDAGSIFWLGRSPRGEHGNPLQCSCLENPKDSGVWQVMGHRVTKSRTGRQHTCSCGGLPR